jgi:hypothetical protein
MIYRISFSYLILVSLIANPTLIFSQEVDRSVIPTAYHSTDLKGEWVLGETFVNDFKSISQELNSGFLQGMMQIISTSVEEYSDFSFDVFPNPFSNYISIQHDFPEPLFIDIHDIHGRTLVAQKLIDGIAVVNMSHLPAGLYAITYYTNTLDRGSYLIIK